jgi:hypothetical protein
MSSSLSVNAMTISQSIRIRNATMGEDALAAFAFTKQLLPENLREQRKDSSHS